MGWYETVFELIDMRSFSNLWFWIALAAVWSQASHRVIGVPFDMVGRAARLGGAAERDLETMVTINVTRLLYIVHVAGLWLIAMGSMLLTGLGLLAFVYGVEFAQAVFLIALPLTFVAVLGLGTARGISNEGLTGEPLRRRLTRHRTIVQAIGIVSIFVTAMWGMYRNLDVGPLGG